VASSGEQYELFLALAGPRIASARAGLAATSLTEREDSLADALIPLAVDAALLGAEGLRELSLAIARGSTSSLEKLTAALNELERATQELGHGDESGARTDETRLRQLAKELSASSSPELTPATTPAASSSQDPDSV